MSDEGPVYTLGLIGGELDGMRIKTRGVEGAGPPSRVRIPRRMLAAAEGAKYAQLVIDAEEGDLVEYVFTREPQVIDGDEWVCLYKPA